MIGESCWDYTPLALAEYNGHEVMEILGGLGEVDPDKAGKWVITPISYITQNGHEKIVALLPSCKAPTPNTSPWGHRLLAIPAAPSLPRYSCCDALGHHPVSTTRISLPRNVDIYHTLLCLLAIFLCGWWGFISFFFHVP